MARDFYPRREADILLWTRQFRDGISVDPQSINLTQEMVDSYALIQQEFADQFMITGSPSTRTPSAIQKKDDLKKQLEQASRALARLVHAMPGMSSTQLSRLALNTRPPGRGSRIGRPEVAPAIVIRSVDRGTLDVQLLESVDLQNCRKPRGVAEAIILAHIGSNPSAARSDWIFVRNTSRARFKVRFTDPGIAPGTKVWLRACWSSPSGEHGPMSRPASTYLGEVLPVMGMDAHPESAISG